jgi:hypothetical protein
MQAPELLDSCDYVLSSHSVVVVYQITCNMLETAATATLKVLLDLIYCAGYHAVAEAFVGDAKAAATGSLMAEPVQGLIHLSYDHLSRHCRHNYDHGRSQLQLVLLYEVDNNVNDAVFTLYSILSLLYLMCTCNYSYNHCI